MIYNLFDSDLIFNVMGQFSVNLDMQTNIGTYMLRLKTLGYYLDPINLWKLWPLIGIVTCIMQAISISV